MMKSCALANITIRGYLRNSKSVVIYCPIFIRVLSSFLQIYLLQVYGYWGMCVIMGGVMLNYIVGGMLMRPIEDNHAAHKVQLFKTLRQLVST